MNSLFSDISKSSDPSDRMRPLSTQSARSFDRNQLSRDDDSSNSDLESIDDDVDDDGIFLETSNISMEDADGGADALPLSPRSYLQRMTAERRREVAVIFGDALPFDRPMSVATPRAPQAKRLVERRDENGQALS